MPKRILFLHRQPPSAETRETLDTALVAAVFDQQVALLFREAGVQQLITTAIPEDITEALRALPDYGVEGIYVCAETLAADGITEDDLLLPVQILTAQAQSDLLAAQDAVVCD